MLKKVLVLAFFVFSQTALAQSDEIYRCGKNTYQNVPCAYSKSKPLGDSIGLDKPIKEPKKINATSKPKPLATTPIAAQAEVEQLPAPAKPAPQVVTKKQTATPAPAPKPEAKPALEAPAKKAPVAPVRKAPEVAPVPTPAPIAPSAEPVATPEQAPPPVATPEPAPEPAKAEEPPPKPPVDLGVCDSLKTGLENIANQKKSGAGEATDLNRQQKELEKVMKESGC